MSLYRRKIQSVGGGSYTVSLPKEWIRRVGLNKGSEVLMVVEPDNTLRIIPSEKNTSVEDHVTIQVGGLDFWHTIRLIVSYYMAGVNTLNIIVDKPEPNFTKELREFVSKRLMGVEVVEESSHQLTLQSIVDTTALTLPKSLNKLSKTVGYMLEDIASAIERNDPNTLLDVVARDDIVDKFYVYIARQLTLVLRGKLSLESVGVGSLAEASLYKMVAKIFERIGDHAHNIAKSLLDYYNVANSLAPKCVRESLLDQLKSLIESYWITTKIVQTLDVNDVEKQIASAEKLREHVTRLYRESLCVEPALLGLMLRVIESMKRVIDYTIDLLESTLDIVAIKNLDGRA
ncbi:MAG TPA: phosphate uptake regulator PhoU [Pyrodictiaceae archaeon]|nr:phosphate uptake regulator PhoU [Pyrodictiaceae archaeon]HIQ55821.1 phosphate uptake regulator PhoU [Pyrodictium sp.]